MNLPKELTTVTPLSKAVALLFFVTLPILFFVFGMNYQKALENNQISPIQSVKILPTLTTQPSIGVKTECSNARGLKCPEGYACDTKQFPDGSGVCVKVGTTVSEYKCPKTEYVDCMPNNFIMKSECTSNFLQWAKENCPNFKGAAL